MNNSLERLIRRKRKAQLSQRNQKYLDNAALVDLVVISFYL